MHMRTTAAVVPARSGRCVVAGEDGTHDYNSPIEGGDGGVCLSVHAIGCCVDVAAAAPGEDMRQHVLRKSCAGVVGSSTTRESSTYDGYIVNPGEP